MVKLSELHKGDSATITRIADQGLALKLLDMGCIPGETIRLEQIAPLGDPLAVSVGGTLLSIRLQEAETILLEKF